MCVSKTSGINDFRWLKSSFLITFILCLSLLSFAQIKTQYDNVYPLDPDEKYFLARKGNKTGIINRDKKIIIPVNKEGSFRFIGNDKFLFHDRKTQEPTFIFTSSGNAIDISEYYLEPGIGGIHGTMANKPIIVRNKKTSKVGIMRFDGSFVVPATYDAIEKTPNDQYIFFRNNNSGFLNMAGQVILTCPCEFLSPFAEGIAVCGKKVPNVSRSAYPTAQISYDVNKGTNYAVQYSYINRSGELFTRNYFDWVGPFYGGFAYVMKKGESFMINRKGNKVAVNQTNILVSYFNQGAAIIRKGHKLGIVNRQGEILAKPIYDEIETENLSIIPGSNLIVSFPGSTTHLEPLVAPKVFDGKVKAILGEKVIYIAF